MSPGPALALAGLALALAAPAAAVESPDPGRLAVLQATCDSAWRVRVVGAHGVFHRRRPLLDSEGVLFPAPAGRQALVEVGDAARPGRRFAWGEIERLQVEQTSARRGALLGLAIGAAMGTSLRLLAGPDLFEQGAGGTAELAILLTIAWTGVGAALGAAIPRSTTIYPAAGP